MVRNANVLIKPHLQTSIGFHFLRQTSAHQQAHLGPLHGQPRVVHEAQKA